MGTMEQSKDLQQASGQQAEEKTFTQEEVNRIVQERLSRTRKDMPDFEAREKEHARKELVLQAKELLSNKGLPKELAGILHFTNEQELKEAVELLEQHCGPEQEESKFQIIPSGGLPKGQPWTERDNTRRAFGLE